MSSHQCCLRGTLELRTGVDDQAIARALGPLLDCSSKTYEKEVQKGAIDRVDAQTLHLSIDLWCAGGEYRIDEIDAAVESLGALVADAGYLELVDYDTGDTDAAITPHFIGETLRDRNLACVQYGLMQAEQWLKSALGAGAMKRIETFVTALPVLETAQADPA